MDIDQNEINNNQGEKSGWRLLLGLLLIVGLCFFIGNVFLIVLALAGGLKMEEGLDIFNAMANPEMRPYIKTGIGLNHLIMFTGSAVIFAYWLKRGEWKKYFLTEKLDFGLLLSFLLLLICAYPIIGASAALFDGVEWASQMDENNIETLMKMLQMDNFSDLLVNLIIVALLPAIGEELLFRGVIQKELLAHIKNHHLAIVIASVIFSGVHLQIQGFLPKFFIGLILGYAYYWTKSIWYPMILHFFNNGMQTLILYIVGDDIESMQEEAIQPEKSYLVIGVVFSCFLCYLIIQNIRKFIDEKHINNV
jgi:membrane protease YdiL (CAAX protease family)